ncbi:MAG: TonB-dependent receptor [Proteobacteria bacterium]|nr:TonB-dependent receptor [Pseudomonadota bacterium]
MHSHLIRLPLAAAIHFACLGSALAADADSAQAQQAPAAASSDKPTAALGSVTVTAQKRTENAQAVPLSIDVLSTDKLSEMNVNGLTDYVKMLPSVSIQSTSPGFSQIYMRGVASGSNGNHSGPSPSVGVYLDEEPITTIQGALDLHVYDVQRVEALAGPQGTLYGASSQAGTIRIITNKPDPSAFAASVSTEVNSVAHGTLGYTVEGFVNLPLRENIALRVTGWDEHDGGYVDNVLGSRFYPTSGITASNANRVHDAYNESWLRGARAALKIDLNDDWSITPTIMGQRQSNGGSYAFDPKLGDLKISHSYPEYQEDRWVQSALTVQGKIGNFDLVYAFAHLNRSDWTDSDYSDYSFWYDTLSGYGKYITDKNGNYINPGQHIRGNDGYAKTSHELRISSPKDQRFRFVGGVFSQHQSHRISQNYQIDGFDPSLSVSGWPGTLWLTKQHRVDDDYAVFGELSYDITDRLTATVGERFFHTENSLRGFFGFGLGYDNLTGSSQGEIACYSNYKFDGGPCTNLDKTTTQNGHVGKANLTYKFDADKMIYATWSEGFRPGGINRRGSLPPYHADFLTNYEFGWKTEWFDHRLRWNGAVFQENWKDFQFAILGQNGLTEIRNANQARIRGIESNLTWAATYDLTLSGGFTYLKSELTANYCGQLDANDNPITNCPIGSTGFPNGPQAPAGTALPLTAKEKANLSARYVFDAFGGEGYFQAAGFVEGRRRTDLRVIENGLIGDMPGYASLDLSAGLKKNAWAFDVYMKNAFDSRGELNRFAECATQVCVQPAGSPNFNSFGQYYVVPIQPRTIGFRVTRNFE